MGKANTIEQLSEAEWHAVKRVVRAAADCGCDAPALPSAIGRMFGRKPAKAGAAMPEDVRAVRDLLCGSRNESIGSRLHTLGYSPAQIAAVALIGG